MNSNYIIIILIILFLFYHNQTEHFRNSAFNKFDAIIYINMEHRRDRQELILEEFEKMGINKEKIFKISGVPVKKNGHKGCAQSHILALTLAKINNWKNVVIFEDDFQFIMNPEDVDVCLNSFLNNVKNWDVIMFSHAYTKMNTINIKHVDKIKSAQTTSGYAVNKHFYDKLLNNFMSANTNMSYFSSTRVGHEPNAIDQKWKSLQPHSEWYAFNPPLGKQRANKSDIQSYTNYSKEK